MSQFTIMLIWGSLTIAIGISMFFTVTMNYDCSTLPKGYWQGECKQVNLTTLGLPFLPIMLGIGIIISGFKLFRDKKPNYTGVKQ